MLRVGDTQVTENILSSQAESPHRWTDPNIISLALGSWLPLLPPLIVQTGHEGVDVVHVIAAIVIAATGRRRVQLDGRLLRSMHLLRLFLP